MCVAESVEWPGAWNSREVEMMSMRRTVVISIAVVVFLSCVITAALGLFPGLAGPARAADNAAAQTGGQKVAVFEDVTITPEQTWGNVVVVGGDVVVEGAVSDSVVVVGGDLTVRQGARVGYARQGSSDDAALVSVFGDVVVEPGAEVSGRVVDVAGGASDALNAAFVDPITRPWKWSSIVSWIVSTIFLAVVALIIVAIAPRQIAAVRERARTHLFSSLGWGVLGAVIGIPLVTIILMITVIGLIVVVPWLVIVVPIVLLFGFVGVAALLGRLILGEGEDSRARLMGAAVLGVVIFSVIRWIPYAGAVILALAVLVGLGAVITALWASSHRPRKHAAPAPAPAPPGPAGWHQPPPGVPQSDLGWPAPEPPTPADQPAAPGSDGPQEPPAG